MPRVKGGPRAHQRHKKVVAAAKGYRGSRSKLFKRAQEAVIRAGEHAFGGRKKRRRDIRTLWITRINAALTNTGVTYSQFIARLKKAGIELNRKSLSEIAIHDPAAFNTIVDRVR